MSYDILQYPLTGSVWSPMQILKGRNVRSNLPMSNAARKQLGIQPEVIGNNDKNAVLPTHDLHVGQHVVYQDSTSKCWYLGVIDSLCPEPWSYKITTRDGIVYRKTQSHLKPYTPQNKNLQPSQCVSLLMKIIQPHVASENWTQEVASDWSNTRTDKQT